MSTTFPSHPYPLDPFVMEFVPSVLFCYDFCVVEYGDSQMRLAIWITFSKQIILSSVAHGSILMFGVCERKLTYFLMMIKISSPLGLFLDVLIKIMNIGIYAS